jgi:sugar/nucleoside kinase (ribokinase family)
MGDDRPDLIVVGDIMADVTVSAGTLAEGGDVNGGVRIRPGGAGANAAVWATAAGARVRLHGRVGDDLMGRLLLQALGERSVETAVTVDPRTRTGSILVVNQAGERSMVADRGANACICPDDLPGRLEGGALLLSAYVLFDPDSESAGVAALERARAPFVAVDAASWPLLDAYGPARFMEVTSRANVLLANAMEFEVIGRAVRRTSEMPWEHLVVKRGPLGAEHIHAPTGQGVGMDWTAIEPAVDTSGSGDAFDGAFLAALVRGASFSDALGDGCWAGWRVARVHETWPEAGWTRSS